MSLGQLPREIQHKIFEYVGAQHLTIILNCCSKLRLAIMDWPGWKSITLKSMNKEDRIFHCILPSFALKVNYFEANSSPVFDDQMLQCLSKYPLKYLSIRGCRMISAQGLVRHFLHPASTECLNTLILSNLASLTDPVLEIIGENGRNLEKLDIGQLRGCNFSDFGLRSFWKNNYSFLKEVNLFACSTIVDETIIQMAQRIGGSLKILHMAGCFLIGDHAMTTILSKCIHLRLLDVSFCWKISDSAFRYEADQVVLKELEMISVNGCFQLGAPTVIFFAKHEKLREIQMSDCPSFTPLEKALLRSKDIIIID